MFMKYQTPIIAVTAIAVDAIQSGQKGNSEQADLMKEETIGAYEADE
jgi:hypothetical protein